jgi:two-component system C4-dicarboxylate transport sensor histidine kinase DctB
VGSFKICAKVRTVSLAFILLGRPIGRQRFGVHEGSFLKRLIPVLLFGLIAIAVAMVVFALSFRANLSRLQMTSAVRLEQSADRLLGQLASFQQLPNLLTRHPIVVGVLNGSASPDVANGFLANTALTVGAEEILVMNRSGTVVASSDYEEKKSPIGQNFGARFFAQRALRGGLGFDHTYNVEERVRDIYFARGVIEGQAPPIGVVVVRVGVAQLEFEWSIDEAVLVFLDENDVVFVTNRVELRLMRDAKGALDSHSARIYPAAQIRPFFPYQTSRWFGFQIWSFGETRVLPKRAFVVSQYIPRLGMTARVFLDVKGALSNARVQSLLALTAMALIGVALLALEQRRRRLSERLEVEAAVNAVLEARVEERTEQLRLAQDQLVQAGKLTALGQMSAGISHELNQPLAAIRNFSENGIKLIERDRSGEARANLGRITAQVDRINRIIKHLREFARKETEIVQAVDLNAVLADAKRLMQTRTRDEAVRVIQTGKKGPVLVMGGPVRLQQVIANLMTNAVDAMVGQEVRDLRLHIEVLDATVLLRVQDTGSGLQDPDRVFEPFYTTKDIGASKGLGLGLSISYGIITSFGGQLRCCNLESGGAEFCMELKRSNGAA